MQIINGHRFYDEQDMEIMMETLYRADRRLKEQIYDYVACNEYGMDRAPLLNIISDPMEYNVEYLYSLDSAVVEKFICIMELFGIV